MNHISIPLAAVEKALKPPRPLTDEEKKELGLAGPINPKALDKLANKYARNQKGKDKMDNAVVSKDSNGWTK